MATGAWSTRETIYEANDSSSEAGDHPELVLPSSSEEEDFAPQSEVRYLQTGIYPQLLVGDDNNLLLDEALKVDPEDDFSHAVEVNLEILKEHATESQTRFFNPPDVRKLLHRGQSCFCIT